MIWSFFQFFYGYNSSTYFDRQIEGTNISRSRKNWKHLLGELLDFDLRHSFLRSVNVKLEMRISSFELYNFGTIKRSFCTWKLTWDEKKKSSLLSLFFTNTTLNITYKKYMDCSCVYFFLCILILFIFLKYPILCMFVQCLSLLF